MASAASPYPTTPPSTYIDTDYPNISSPISTKAPAKPARSVAHESESSEDKLDEISDTESSSDAFRRTASAEDLPESMDGLDTAESNKEEEEEEEEERKRGEELKEEKRQRVTSEDMSINRYVEEAKQRAKVLREKSKFSLILLYVSYYHSWLLETQACTSTYSNNAHFFSKAGQYLTRWSILHHDIKVKIH